MPAGRPNTIVDFRALVQREGGIVPFRRYMELALYHPELGYYRRGAARVGRGGDFFTSVSVGPLLGRILARRLAACRHELGEPAAFRVVEYGGAGGQLRADVLAELPGLPYTLVEAHDPPPPPFVGCVLANELLDALPVHRVRVEGGRWRELYVAVDTAAPAGLGERTGELSDPRLAERLQDLPAPFMEGYTTEVNLAAEDWLRDTAARLQRGFFLLLDYGLSRAEYYSPQRPQGTLRGYWRHTLNTDYYLRPGEQDLTAHVEFDSLLAAARAAGLELVSLTDQTRFLLDSGEELLREIVTRHAGQSSPELRAVHQLLHPGHMGLLFKALILRRP